ncbi:MAG: ATP-dependent sacrificial sulfur transferase LarE [Candidatus Omnitrophica bacterium]|nr:ATP-dependent sacrificial sulfur transferase LarE [Candidatus Omnitrophota bacterium]
MKKSTLAKLEKLKVLLKRMGKVLVAYSGGLDSSFLLKFASDTLGRDLVLAITANSCTYPASELKEAKSFTERWRIKHLIIKTHEEKNPLFIKNSSQRCYYCKKELFYRLKKIAKKYKIRYIIDGTNTDDTRDFRPGERAKKLYGVRSPLREARITKEEIRYLSKKLNLSTYNKPARACLASRIPYGFEIKPEILKRIEKAEEFLNREGLSQVRVRDYGNLARIEVDKKEFPKLIKKSSILIKFFKRLGYIYITLDLEGYRPGSMNEVFKSKKGD